MESQSDCAQAAGGVTAQEKHLAENYITRQIQENLKYAAEQGQTKMRYPTRETVAKIEGYTKKAIPRPTREQELSLTYKLDRMWKEYFDSHEAELRNIPFSEMEQIGRENIPGYSKMRDELDALFSIPTEYDYSPKYKTILKKYADFPKQYQKLFGKNTEVRTVTDSKGNTWYEVDVPESYKNGTGQIIFAQGGKLINKYQAGDKLVEKYKYGIPTAEVTDNRLYQSSFGTMLPEVRVVAKGDPRKVNNDYYKAHSRARANL
jgi:hypothetical protein